MPITPEDPATLAGRAFWTAYHTEPWFIAVAVVTGGLYCYVRTKASLQNVPETWQGFRVTGKVMGQPRPA